MVKFASAVACLVGFPQTFFPGAIAGGALRGAPTKSYPNAGNVSITSTGSLGGTSCNDGVNWCCSGWMAETTQQRADGTGEYCQKWEDAEGWHHDLSCTPFNFRPNAKSTPAAGCDGGSPLAFADNAAPSPFEQNRVWRAPNEKAYWVFHACDGAGIQGSDCNGDIFYAEYIGDPDSVSQDQIECHNTDPNEYFNTGIQSGPTCNDKDDPSNPDLTWGCQHNVCSHQHHGLGQNTPYQCGWWNYGKFDAKNSWYPGAKWTGSGYDTVSTWPPYIKGADGWVGAYVALYDWVCHGADTSGVCDNGQVDKCGKDPNNTPKSYPEFPEGNINQAFTGDASMRCFCDNEPSWYTGDGPKTAPPGARLFWIKYLESDPDNNMWILEVKGPELSDQTNYYYADGVQLFPSVPGNDPTA